MISVPHSGYLRFPSFPALGAAGQFLSDHFGYSATLIDGCWSVPLADAALRDGPVASVTPGRRVSFGPSNYQAAAQELAAAISDESRHWLDETAASRPDSIEIPAQFGDLSIVDRLLAQAMLVDHSELAGVLAGDLLPFFSDRLRQTTVRPIVANAVVTQRYVSIAKIAAISDALSFQVARDRVQNHQALKGADLTPLDVLDLLDAITRLFPLPLTLPVRRGFCAWHFYGNGTLRLFRATYSRGFYQSFLSSTDARASDWSHAAMIAGLGPLNNESVDRFLIFAVLGVNRLMSWAHDHRNHTSSAGDVDFKRQLQIYASLKFLIADLLGIHHSYVPHSQATFAFGFVDKIANLRAMILGASKSEESAMFREAYSMAHKEFMRALIEPELRRTDDQLANSLLSLLECAYDEIHRHVRGELGPTVSEADVLDRLRHLRRLNHGANLDREGFSQLYFGSKATVPSTIATVPFFMTCALLCDPARFLSYRT